MEGHELLGKVNRVKAPADFEERVFRRLGEEKRARSRRRAAYRYAFAGSAAVLIIAFVLLNQAPLAKRAPMPYAEHGKAAPAAVRTVSYPSSVRAEAAVSYLPVLETVDYSTEFRSASSQPRTVYILEQVSEVRPSEIKY